MSAIRGVLQGKFAAAGFSPDASLSAHLDGSPGLPPAERSYGRRRSFLPSGILSAGGEGRGLPSPTREKLERFFAADFSSVRVHEGGQAASIGAEAFTCGEDVYFAKGAFQPFAPSGLSLLAHELTHVIQQRGGQHSPGPSGVTVLEDAKLELEAEVNANRFLKSDTRGNSRALSASGGGLASPPATPGRASGGSQVLQPRMQVGVAADATDAATELQAIAGAAALTADVALQAGWQAIHGLHGDETLTAILASWIGGISASSLVWESIGYTAPPARNWHFVNYDDALRILIAETLRPRSEALEAGLADQVLASPAILEGVRRYVTRVRRYVNRLIHGGHRPVDWLQTTSIYGYYYNSYASTALSLIGLSRGTTIQYVLDHPNDHALDYLMAAIKDTTQKFWDWFSEVASPPIASTSINVPGARSLAHYRDGLGLAQSEAIAVVRPAALDENSATMRYIRSKAMLVDHGPSFSTGRMMQLGRAAGAPDEELEAVAWGIFAFWNKKYWRSTSGIHCWHFVMDMLRNYVPAFNSLEYPTSVATGMSAGLTALVTPPVPPFQIRLDAVDGVAGGWVAP